MYKKLGWRVIELVGEHRLHDANVVRHFGEMRNHRGEFRAALAVLGELVGGPEAAQLLPRAYSIEIRPTITIT